MTEPHINAYLKLGTPVRLGLGGNHTLEFGVVVHCWLDEFNIYDCCVAFFGNEQPKGKPEYIPYVLRYPSTSLVVLDIEK